MRHLSEIICEKTPLTLPPDASVKEACRKMREHRTGSVLVTDADGHLLGIFTGRDVVARVVAEGRDSKETKLADVMTRRPTTMAPNRSALDALRLMWDGGFRHVPLVERGVVVGIVSRGDFSGLEQDCFDGERALWEHMR